MHTLIKISDAAIIAIHAIDYMLKNKSKTYSAKEIAKNLGVSYNHLSKVLQRLVAENFLSTTRGPAGGYLITEEGKKATIRNIISTIEGNKKYTNCLVLSHHCKEKKCIFRDFLTDTLKNFNKTLDRKISEIHN